LPWRARDLRAGASEELPPEEGGGVGGADQPHAPLLAPLRCLGGHPPFLPQDMACLR
jgi:hypothetical protein